MTAKEFIHTIWICEPPKGSITIADVTEAMEKYSQHRIAEFISLMPIGNEEPSDNFMVINDR